MTTRHELKTYLESEILGWAQDQVLLDAIRNQNSQTAGYTQEEIDALDTAWRAEVGLRDRPTIAPVLENAASDFLRERVAAAAAL